VTGFLEKLRSKKSWYFIPLAVFLFLAIFAPIVAHIFQSSDGKFSKQVTSIAKKIGNNDYKYVEKEIRHLEKSLSTSISRSAHKKNIIGFMKLIVAKEKDNLIFLEEVSKVDYVSQPTFFNQFSSFGEALLTSSLINNEGEKTVNIFYDKKMLRLPNPVAKTFLAMKKKDPYFCIRERNWGSDTFSDGFILSLTSEN